MFIKSFQKFWHFYKYGYIYQIKNYVFVIKDTNVCLCVKRDNFHLKLKLKKMQKCGKKVKFGSLKNVFNQSYLCNKSLSRLCFGLIQSRISSSIPL